MNNFNNGNNQNNYQYNNYNNGYPDQQHGYYVNQPVGQQTIFGNSMSGTGSLEAYSRKVFAWMFAGLSITFLIGFAAMLNPVATLTLIGRFSGIFFGLLIAEVVAVFILGFFVAKLPPTACKVLFIAYSIINGITIAPTLLYFEIGTVFFVFAVTAGIFGAMTIYGMVTKRDLTKLGTILLFGLLGLIIFSIIAIFVNIPMLETLICLAGIAIFIGFTAYDTQKIKSYYYSYQGNTAVLEKTAVIAALNLYLDFINLFLYILRLLNNSRN